MVCMAKNQHHAPHAILLLLSENLRICFRFYQYLPMIETHVIGYQVKATPLQGTMVQVVS